MQVTHLWVCLLSPCTVSFPANDLYGHCEAARDVRLNHYRWNILDNSAGNQLRIGNCLFRIFSIEYFISLGSLVNLRFSALLEGGHGHGLLSQAKASICHCCAKHYFGTEEIESRSYPAAFFRLSSPYHFHQPDQKHIGLPPAEGQKATKPLACRHFLSTASYVACAGFLPVM